MKTNIPIKGNNTEAYRLLKDSPLEIFSVINESLSEGLRHLEFVTSEDAIGANGIVIVPIVPGNLLEARLPLEYSGSWEELYQSEDCFIYKTGDKKFPKVQVNSRPYVDIPDGYLDGYKHEIQVEEK